MTRWLGLSAAVLLLAGCSGAGGAREIDYTQQRGISADIAASHATGSDLLQRGETVSGEPLGVMPWTLGEEH